MISLLQPILAAIVAGKLHAMMKALQFRIFIHQKRSIRAPAEISIGQLTVVQNDLFNGPSAKVVGFLS